MAINPVVLAVADGTEMRACTAAPPGKGPFPGLIVFQEVFGVNHHIRDLVDRFAREGFVTIAPELFHRTAAPGFEAGYTEFDQVRAHSQKLTVPGLEADARASWAWLQDQPQVRRDAIASTGYCLGGRASFIANTILPLKAAVSYYGSGIPPELIKRAPALHGPMLFFWGGLDQHILPEQIAAVGDGLKKAGKPFLNAEISYADHGFFCDERASYQPQAAREAWALTLAFLREKLA